MDFKNLLSDEEILSSLDSVSLDSSGSEIEYLLKILDCDPAWFSTDEEYYPSELDASETDESQLRVQDLDLIAYGEPQVFLRGVPEEVSTWLKCKVYLDKSPQ